MTYIGRCMKILKYAKPWNRTDSQMEFAPKESRVPADILYQASGIASSRGATMSRIVIEFQDFQGIAHEYIGCG